MSAPCRLVLQPADVSLQRGELPLRAKNRHRPHSITLPARPTGNGGSSDGNVDTVSVIDLEANPPRVIDHVTVGDSPEGLAISPNGDLAITVEARGSSTKGASFYNPSGAVTILGIDGKKVRNIGEISVGALPEGAVFSPDGGYLYVGNFIDGDLWVLKVDGTTLIDTAQRIKLPGHPASMRAGPQ